MDIDWPTVPHKITVSSDGVHTHPNGEIAYIENGKFHRIEGPARYMPDGRSLHYVNGVNVTSEVEDMYSRGDIEWVNESNYKNHELDILTPESCFTIELAFSGGSGPTAQHEYDQKYMLESLLSNQAIAHAGGRSMGKSAMSDMLIKQALNTGKKVGFFAWE